LSASRATCRPLRRRPSRIGLWLHQQYSEAEQISNPVLNASTHSDTSLPKGAKNYIVKNNLTDGIAVGDHEGVVLENNLCAEVVWHGGS